jgi:hypothetical protein
MMVHPPTTPILSRTVLVDDIPASGLSVVVEPGPDQRASLARLNGLIDLPAMRATLVLRPEGRSGIWASGEVTAKVVQTCVVTLEPFEAEVVEPIDVHFLPEAPLEALRAARAKRLAAGVEPEPNEDDEPDQIIDGRIDVGALASEYLTLGLDPYPKKPGVSYVEPVSTDGETGVSPFAALKALKTDKA